MRALTLASHAAELGLHSRRAHQFVQLARHLCAGVLTGAPPAMSAERAGDNELATILRAAVPAAAMHELTEYQSLASSFATTLRNISVLDALIAGGARVVPWTGVVGVLSFASGATPSEGAAKAVGRLQVLPSIITEHKAVALVVLTRELFNQPDFPADTVRTELSDACVAAMDGPLVAALTNGVTPIASGGDIASDAAAALQAVPRGTTSRIVWVMGTQAHDQYMALSPDMTPRALNNSNVVRSDALTADSMALIDASQIAIADRGIRLDAARQAALELSDEPSGAADSPPAPAQLVSLWQTGAVALRAEREVKFSRLRSNAVAVISDIDWIGAGSP